MQAAVVTVSAKGFLGQRKDESGTVIVDLLQEAGYQVVHQRMVPDEQEAISNILKELSDKGKVNLIITTGGTGFSKHDVTPEATSNIIERFVPGIPEKMRWESSKQTSHAMLSRGVAGIRKETLIINLPGSPKACRENLSSVLPALKHGLRVLTGVDKECGNPNRRNN